MLRARYVKHLIGYSFVASTETQTVRYKVTTNEIQTAANCFDLLRWLPAEWETARHPEKSLHIHRMRVEDRQAGDVKHEGGKKKINFEAVENKEKELETEH